MKNVNQKENKNEKEKCEMCRVSENAMQILKESGREKYFIRKEAGEKERWDRVHARKIKKIVIISLLALLIVGGVALSVFNYFQREVGLVSDKQKITVFYSPTCSCCGQYLSYLKRNGFEVLEEKDMAKRMDILEKYHISQEMTSCHTSIVGDYFVEGHMPVEIIRKLLEEKPKVDGIVLPGMPQGSPGMPGLKLGKWTIYGFTGGVSSEFMVY